MSGNRREVLDAGSGGGGDVEGDEQDSENNTSSTPSTSPPDDAIDPGPGAGASSTSTTPDSEPSNDGGGSTSSPPDDIANSGPSNDPTPADNSSGSSSGADTQDTPTNTQSSSTGNTSNSSGGSSPSPPDDVAQSGPSNDPTPLGPNPPGNTRDFEQVENADTGGGDGDSETQGGDDGIVTLREQHLVDSRDHLDGEDVRVEFDSEGGNLEYTASGAAATFAANNEGVDESDVTATRGENGRWKIQFVGEKSETYLRNNTDRASQSRSLSTTGLGTSGTPRSRAREGTVRASESVNLSTTGLGTSGTQQSRTRERTPRASESVSLGTTGVGTSGTSQSRRQSQTARASQSASLSTRSLGTDLGEGRERFGDVPIRVPSPSRNEGPVGEIVERSAGAASTSLLGPSTGDVVELAAREAGISGKRTETVLREVSDDYRSRVSRSFEEGILSDTITDDVVGLVASERTANRAGETVSQTAESAVQSLNPFQAVVGLKEAGEFGVEAAKETAEGDLGVNVNVGSGGVGVSTTEQGFAGRAGRAGGQVASAAIEEAQENPVEAGAMLTGSLLGTGAVLGAASKAGRTSGAVARYSIQPGEEIAGTVGYRATKAATSARTAERLFPDGEVLVSEEGVIRAGRSAGSSVRSAGSRVANLRSGGFTVRPSPRQAELVQRFRPGSGRGTLDEFGTPERARAPVPGRSELGSDTESILDATTSVDVETPSGSTARATTRAEGESTIAAEADQDESGTLPLYSEIRDAGGVRPYIRDEDLPGARPILSSEVENFRNMLGDQRGQASLTGRSRSRQREPETESSEFDEARVGPELQRRQLAQRRQLSGDFEGEPQPFRTRSVDGGRPRDTRTRETKSEVSTRTPAETFFPQEDDAAAGETVSVGRSDLGAREVGVQGTRPKAGLSARPDTTADVTADTRTRSRQQQEFETGLWQETELRAELRAETGIESEVEAETAFESRTRIRGESNDRSNDGRDRGFSVGFGADGGRGASGVLVPGWLEETATDIATRGFSGDIAPSQEALRAESTAEQASGSLPTQQFLEDGETQDDIEAAQSFLSFGTVGGPDDSSESFFGGES